jgi:hypothetical protein
MSPDQSGHRHLFSESKLGLPQEGALPSSLQPDRIPPKYAHNANKESQSPNSGSPLPSSVRGLLRRDSQWLSYVPSENGTRTISARRRQDRWIAVRTSNPRAT